MQMRSSSRVPAKDRVRVPVRSFERNDGHTVSVSPMTVMRRLASEGECESAWRELANHGETHALLVNDRGHRRVAGLGSEAALGRQKDPAFPVEVVPAFPDHNSRKAVLQKHGLGKPEDPATYLLHEQAVVASHQLGGRLLTEAEWQGLASDQNDPFIFKSLDFYKHRFEWNMLEWVGDRYGDYNPSKLQDPTGSIDGIYRVCRGGNYYDARVVRAANRGLHCLDYCHYLLGFRVRWSSLKTPE